MENWVHSRSCMKLQFVCHSTNLFQHLIQTIIFGDNLLSFLASLRNICLYIFVAVGIISHLHRKFFHCDVDLPVVSIVYALLVQWGGGLLYRCWGLSGRRISRWNASTSLLCVEVAVGENYSSSSR